MIGGFVSDEDCAALLAEMNQHGTSGPLVTRVRSLSVSQRAMIGARVERWRRKEKAAQMVLRREWIAMARSSFVVGEQMPCFVCERYQSLTQAHHVFPLAIQASVGMFVPNQDYEWVCPTHHVAIHRRIDALIRNHGIPRVVLEDEEDRMEELAMMFVRRRYPGGL